MTTDIFIPYARQAINQSDQKAIAKACMAPMLTRGPLVTEFEKQVANRCDAAYGVSFTSGTAALQAAAFAVDVNSFDRLIVPSNTFIASAIAANRGCQTLIAEIDKTTGNLCLDNFSYLMQQKHSRGRNIVIPVHFAGVPIDMDRLESLIRDPNTMVIEDAAHAIGSHYPDGSPVGCCKRSAITIFSFHPAKVITCGEGGMALTNDASLANRLRLFRDNGIERQGISKYQVKAITGNFHMNEIQAALGLSQLKRLDKFISRRFEIMERYASLLQEIDEVSLLGGPPQKGVAYHLCSIQIDFKRLGIERESLIQELKEEGIGTQVHYIPLYRHPVFDRHPYLSETEHYYSRALTLPLYPDLTNGQIERICAILKKTLKKQHQNLGPYAV